MRTIEWTVAFRKDYRKVKSMPRHKDLDQLLQVTVDLLANDLKLPERLRDHGLIGNWKQHRECHLKPDLLLIYKLPDGATLRLVRLGSHSQLFSK